MKNKLTHNLVLKIASIVVAFVFWLVIVNITDPTISKTFYDIPVEVLNENVITSANQVYEIEDGDKVRVSVKGKRSFVDTLKEEDFIATADMSELSKVNAVSINVRLNKHADSEYEMDWGNAVLKVKLEKRVSRKFKVEVAYQGELSENYVLGEMVAKPNIVEVSCGESKFKKIDHVGVMVTLNGESEDFEAEYSPVLYDEYGEVIDGTNVTFSNDIIVVSTKVLTTKEIPIEIDTTGMPADGYRLVQTDFRPESIRVSGSAEALSKVLPIKITIDVGGAKKNIEKEIDLTSYLPEGLAIVGDTETVSVRCVIEKNGRRTFLLTGADIAVKNLPAGCTIDFEDEDRKYSVVVTGEESVLQDLAINDLGAYIDLSGLGAGTHLLDLKYNLTKQISVKSKTKVNIILKSIEDEVDEETPTATPEGDTEQEE